MVFSKVAGEWAGQGVWRDDAGESHCYEVTMGFAPREDGLRLWFRHVFVEEDVPDVVMDLTLSLVAPGLLAFKAPGLPAGRGYVTDDTLSYTIPVPGNAVQVTCHLSGADLAVTGCAQKNSAGRFIMWEEHLTRAQA